MPAAFQTPMDKEFVDMRPLSRIASEIVRVDATGGSGFPPTRPAIRAREGRPRQPIEDLNPQEPPENGGPIFRLAEFGNGRDAVFDEGRNQQPDGDDEFKRPPDPLFVEPAPDDVKDGPGERDGDEPDVVIGHD